MKKNILKFLDEERRVALAKVEEIEKMIVWFENYFEVKVERCGRLEDVKINVSEAYEFNENLKKVFKPIICIYCGTLFTPNSGVQKRCKDCAKQKTTYHERIAKKATHPLDSEVTHRAMTEEEKIKYGITPKF